MMSTIHENGNKYRIITKGAPDILIEKCNKIYLNGKEIILTAFEKEKIKKQNLNMAEDALRVIAVAYLNIVYNQEKNQAKRMDLYMKMKINNQKIENKIKEIEV